MAFKPRQHHFTAKAGLDGDESRRRREDVTVQIRKQERDKQNQKRRAGSGQPSSMGSGNQGGFNNGGMGIGPQPTEQFVPIKPTGKLTEEQVKQRLRNLRQLVEMCMCNDPQRQLMAVTEFRQLLSIEKHPPIQAIVDSGVVPRLVQFLTFDNNHDLQFEAAWALTNIASGSTEHTMKVVEHQALPLFIRLLNSPNPDVKDQSVWALGNIAGDTPELRDRVLFAGIVPPLLAIFADPNSKLSIIRNATWTLSNLCRGKPAPDFRLIQPILPILSRLVHSDDPEILTDACWALSYITDDTTNQKIQQVVQTGLVPRLVHCLMHPRSKVQVPALRTVGNIVTGDDAQTQAILDCSPLPALLGLLTHPKKTIRKEACWTISNITAGTEEQIQAVLQANIGPPLVTLCREAEFDIRKEAAWALSNATAGGSENHIRYLGKLEVVSAFCGLLDCDDPKVVLVALEGLENVLKVGKKDQANGIAQVSYTDQVEECGGLDLLEKLQRVENEEIYDKALKILKTYFDLDDDGDAGENQPAPVPGGNQFGFNVQNNNNTNYTFNL